MQQFFRRHRLAISIFVGFITLGIVLLVFLLPLRLAYVGPTPDTEPATEAALDVTAESTEFPPGTPTKPVTAIETTTIEILAAPLPTATTDFGSVAYDVPTHMVRDKVVQVILLVSPSEDDADALTATLTQQLGEVGQEPTNVVTTTVKVAKRMSATLTGIPEDAFDIRPLQSSDMQLLDDQAPTQWEWSVVPNEGGTHRLILRIERLVERDGDLFPVKEEVHRDDVTVEVPIALRLRDASAGLAATALIAGLALVLFLSFALRRRSAPTTRSRLLQAESLPRADIHSLVPTLAERLAPLSIEQRLSFLSQAGVGDLVTVDLVGSPQSVSATILDQLNRYGLTAEGDIALARLLNYLIELPALPRSDKAVVEEILRKLSATNPG